MELPLITRLNSFESQSKLVTFEDIIEFEKSFGISLPSEYKIILTEYGKLSNSNNIWFYNDKDKNINELLLDGTFSLSQQVLFKENHWGEVVNKNSYLTDKSYLPIISTYSGSDFFLIGLDNTNSGKIYFYDDDFENFQPAVVAESLFEFFTTKIYGSFPLTYGESGIGCIEIRRSNGVEFWDVTSSNFSVTEISEKNILNFWVESDHKTIKKLDDTGDTPVMYEVKFPIIAIEEFANPWKFELQEISQTSEKWGEESKFEYYDNFYYYSHESFDKQTIEIIKGNEQYYYIRVTGEKDDPISSVYGKAKFIITVKVKLNSEFSGFWCEG